MIKMGIEGDRRTGWYRVNCECGACWRGRGEKVVMSTYSPALPIAECVAHLKMEHEGEELDVRFSATFQDWLTHYWELASFRQASMLYQPKPDRV